MRSHRRAARALVACLALAAIPAASAESSVADVFEKVKDSVVVVRTLQREAAPEGRGTTSAGGLGSGVLVDATGLVLTAAHVVQVAEKIEVELTDGDVVPARVVAAQALTDVALLRLERAPRKPVAARLGDSEQVRVGDTVFIVGAPLGISHSLSVGHIGGRREANVLFGGLESAELFQTDASINQGNSGGPMFNLSGEVIGIVSSILSRSGGFEGIGFAVTSATARRLMAERTPWTGLEGMLIAGELAGLLNVPGGVGLLVQRVATNSPAGRMGLLPGSVPATIAGEELLLGGDVILEVAGIKLADPAAPQRIREAMAGTSTGQQIPIVVLRSGRRFELVYTAP